MTNYDSLISIFKETSTRVSGVRSFITGQLDEVDIKKLGADAYPLVYLEPVTTVIDQGSITYTFTLYIMEQTPNDIEEPESQVLGQSNKYQIREARNNSYSNLLQTLRSYINIFKQNLSSQPLAILVEAGWVPDDMVLQLPITCEPFTMRFNNILTGWNADLVLEFNNTNDFCTTGVFLGSQ